jgi:SAM-dependent methyltransferase
MDPRDYQAAVAAEQHHFSNCGESEELPAIFHYWSNQHVRPALAALGFGDAREMCVQRLARQLRDAQPRRFLSIGSGACPFEIEIARELVAAGHRAFTFHCLDLNALVLERGRAAARAAGVGDHFHFEAVDLNFWTPARDYDAAIACQSLHHVMNLEGLFDGVRRAIGERGEFLITDIIGRNGHLRWPEALAIVREFWSRLPPSYRFHHLLKKYDETYEDHDCSTEGFEGVRSQDILPLLVERFHFHVFAAFGNLIDPFTDRGFGPNFNPEHPWDRAFIDEVHARDEMEMQSGRLTPTHLIAVVSNAPCEKPLLLGGRTPHASMRKDVVDVQLPATEPYQWGSWPHSAESELKIACTRLASYLGIEEATRRWALGLERELEESRQLIELFRGEAKEKAAWATDLEAARIGLEEKLRASREQVRELESELEARTRWAQRLDRELEEKSRRVELLESYLRRPWKLAGAMWRRRSAR